jgi:hypothetical protein
MTEALRFSLEKNGDFLFFGDGFRPGMTAGACFWRAFLDDGVYREISVYSSSQKPVKITTDDDETAVYYDRLLAENGAEYAIGLCVRIKREYGALSFGASIDNKSYVRVNELQLPFMDFEQLCGAPEDEMLYLPTELGARYKNPRGHAAGQHTEYMAADQKAVWLNTTYPHLSNTTALAMPWLGVQCGPYFLYMGNHDPEFRISGFNIGTGPRGAKSRLMLTVSHYPAAVNGETLCINGPRVKVFEGDWRDGASYYRAWAEASWYKPKPIPDWIRDMTGWLRIILKHQYGEIFYRYDDLPRLYEESKRYGIDTLLIFGWWKGCFDNSYPEYEFDPELGGEDGFKKAIEQIHVMGGKVILYSNGILIDVKTDFYKTHGKLICAKDIDGNEYRDRYKFSSEGSLLKNGGYKSFVHACHSTQCWREKLLETTQKKQSVNPDAVFYDQLSICMDFCFDKSHPHKNRIDQAPAHRLESIRAIRSILPKRRNLGSEAVTDRIAAELDFVHGLGGNGTFFGAADFPDLYRHTFPETVVSNRFIHDERNGFREILNYAFVYGLVFDAGIYRCRASLSAVPAYAEHLKMLIDLKEQYHRFFCGGVYRSAFDLGLPEKVYAAEYLAGGEAITALCNNTDSDAEVEVYDKIVVLSPKSVMVAQCG